MRRVSRNNVCLYNNVKTNTNLTNMLPKLTILEEWEMRIMLVLRGEYIRGMKELNFYFAQCNMPKMEKKSRISIISILFRNISNVSTKSGCFGTLKRHRRNLPLGIA